MVLALFFVLTVARNAVWADPVGLWRDAVRKAPSSWSAHFGAGTALADAGKCRDAIAEFNEALRLAPRTQVYMNLGMCLVAEQRLDAPRW